MPKTYPLDKTFPTGASYRAESDKAYIIRKVGTTSDTKASLKVAGGLCLEIISTVAPTQVKAANRWPLLDLGDNYIVVPPNKTLEIIGESAKFVRVKGEILEMGPGELLPAEHLTRYDRQTKKYVSYETATWTSAAAAAIPKGNVHTMIDRDTPAAERHTFQSRCMGYSYCSAYPSGVYLEELGTRIYVQGAPLDNLDDGMGFRGISSVAAPHPPKDADGAEGFSLKERPIVLEPGRHFTIEAWNANAAFTLATGETFTCNVTIVKEIELLS